MQSYLKHFYNDKKILITGHTTFMGSWLVMMLHALGAKLTGCSIRPPAYPNLYEENDMYELIESHIGEVRDYEFLHDIVTKHQPEIVIHLSSVCGFCDSIEPKELYALNLLGTLNALEVCRQSESVRVFMNLVPDYSNGSLFVNCDKRNKGEMDLITGSFRSTEFLTTGYRNAYFDVNSTALHHKSIVNVKTFPPIGGGDWSKNNLIQEYVQTAQQRKKQITARAVGSRTMLHVLDMLNGVLTAVQNLYEQNPDVVSDIKIYPEPSWFKDDKWVAQTFYELWGDKEISIKSEQKQPVYSGLQTDDSLLGYTDIPGWTPRWDAVTALRRTVEWHQARERGANMQRFSLSQVDEYLNEPSAINQGVATSASPPRDDVKYDVQ